MSHRNALPPVTRDNWTDSWSAERHRLRALVGDLRREVHDLTVRLEAERAKVRHLEAAAERRWWQR